MSYHDLYWRPDDGSWPPTDPMLLLGKLYTALKPGGVVVVEDHVANPGGEPDKVVADLHRIDPSVVKRDFEKAGFVLDGESRVLANPGGRPHEARVRRGDPRQDRPVPVPVQEACEVIPLRRQPD